MSRGAQGFNPNRKGGRNLWSDAEMRTLEGGFETLVTRLPGRARGAVAHKILKMVEERADDGAEQP